MAKNLRFNHNYGHCAGEECDKKDDCVHHLAFPEAVDNNLKDIKIFDHCKDLELNYVKVRIEK